MRHIAGVALALGAATLIWGCDEGRQAVSTGGTESSGDEGQSSTEEEGGVSGDSLLTGGGDPPSLPPMCQEACEKDEDCLAGLTCIDARCSDGEPVFYCDGDVECWPPRSGWVVACSDSSPCAIPGQSCISAGTLSVCATVVTESINCAQLGFEELTMPLADGAGDTTVCGSTATQCINSLCINPCTPELCSLTPETPVCNPDTRLCECSETSCATNASACVEGRCVCQSDDDCTIGPVDSCVEGTCSCGSVDICESVAEPVHPSTTWACE